MVHGLVPFRHPVVAGAQNPVNGAAGGAKLVPVFRVENVANQPVHNRVRDAGQIIAAVLAPSSAAPIGPHLWAGRRRKGVALRDDIEVVAPQPLLLLLGVHPAQPRLNAKFLKPLRIRAEDALADGIVDEELDLQPLAFGIFAHAVLQLPARFVEKLAPPRGWLAGTGPIRP